MVRDINGEGPGEFGKDCEDIERENQYQKSISGAVKYKVITTGKENQSGGRTSVGNFLEE